MTYKQFLRALRTHRDDPRWRVLKNGRIRRMNNPTCPDGTCPVVAVAGADGNNLACPTVRRLGMEDDMLKHIAAAADSWPIAMDKNHQYTRAEMLKALGLKEPAVEWVEKGGYESTG